MKPKKKKLKTLRSLKKKAWDLISIHVRSSQADWRGYVQCYTCPAIKPWKEMDAGHYIHNKLDYDHRNLKPQCSRCNRFLHGNLGIYGERLTRENSVSWVELLRRDAQATGNNYKRAELEEIIIKYKNLILLNTKPE